jgi:folate-dependent phosphoribosylglycinamide formyltransferase PurN
VLEWSLLLGEAPGVTVHWIDGGVDTGVILGFSPLEVATDETLESLRERAVVLSARAIAEQVARLQQAEGTVETSGSNAVPQYFALHPRLRQRAAARLMENVD